MPEEAPVIEPTAEEILGFNPFDPEFRRDPYPVYRRLRDEDPVHRSPFGIWVLSRYEDCAALLHDRHASSDQTKAPSYALMREQMKQAGLTDDEMNRRQPFLFLDPPDHTRLRSLVSKAFTARGIQELAPRIQQIVDELIDAAEERGSLEIIEEFAYLVPVTIISEMLGVPPEDHDKFKGWSRELARSLDPDIVLPPEVVRRRRAAGDAFAEYFSELIADHRKNPKEDLLTALISAEDEGDKLTEEELITTGILLLIAGHETTVNLIGNGVLSLLRNRDQFDRLSKDPGLARGAVEEVLRYDPPVQFTGRLALEDINFGETTISPGEQVIVLLASANRDPGEFTEPDSFDISRQKNPHISFSMGTHFCLGAPLARLEGRIALETLARRLPNLELKTDRLEYKENVVLRGLAALPVAF